METIFSPFEVVDSVITIDKKAYKLKCVGKLNTEMEVKKITKTCAGVVKKTRIKGTGHGTGTLSLHISYELYTKLYGMDKNKKLIEGVTGYGSDSVHPEFSYTGVGKDEEGVEVLIAIPVAVVASGQKWNFENGAEEVQEIELEIEILPDENEEGMYCIPVADLPSSVTREKWLNEFSSSLVTAPTA